MRQDICYALRVLLQNRSFSLVAILALALGIGANTAMYSVVYTVLLKPLPYRQPDRLVWIAVHNQRFHAEMVSVPDFLSWRAESHAFDSIAAFMPMDQTLTGVEDPIEVRTTFCSESMSRLFGVQPALGRDFLPEEFSPSAQSHPALVSGRFFRAHFGGNREALGKTLTLNSPYTLVGVLPADFRLALPTPFGAQLETDVIVPYVIDPATQRRNPRLLMMSAMHPFVLNAQPYSVQVLARLRPGILATARAEIETINAHLPKPSFVNPGDERLEMSLLRDRILGNTGRPLLILLGAVAFVLLIACGNVANLLLARAATRRREVALRMALGAGRARVIRQFLTESILLALVGGAAGVFLAMWCIGLLVHWSPVMVPHLKDTSLDPAVLAFALAISVLTGILFGIAPAVSGTGFGLSEALKQGGASTVLLSGRRGMHGLLVVSEVALALVLMAGAGLMVKSLWLMHVSTAAVAPDRVLTADLQIRSPRFREPAQSAEFLNEFLARIESLPGVRAAAVSSTSLSGLLSFENSAGEPVKTNFIHTTSHYFLASGVRLLKGRNFTDRDRAGAPRVVIVNDALARRLSASFPRQTPVGRKIQVPLAGTPLAPPLPGTIIGVVSDFRSSRLDAEVEPELYIPVAQDPVGGRELLVRASSDPTALIGAIRSQGQAMSNIALLDPKTLADRLNASIAPRRFQMALLIVFALLAVFLALVGIYGVVSYMVTRRTREIGIRVALGAQRSQVIRMILGRGLRLVCAGVMLGLAASFGLTRLMQSFLYGVQPTDPFTFAAVSALLVVIAALAAWVPARRAATINPTIALRYE